MFKASAKKLWNLLTGTGVVEREVRERVADSFMRRMTDEEVRRMVESSRPQLRAASEKYAKLSRSTDRCDRAAAEAAVSELYKTMNLSAPTFIWFDSPFAGIRAAVLVDLFEVVCKIAEPTGKNKLVFSAQAMEHQFTNPAPAPLEAFFSRPANFEVAWQIQRSVPDWLDPAHIPTQHDRQVLDELSVGIMKELKNGGKPLDSWLDFWQSIGDQLPVNGKLSSVWDQFGDLFWSMSDHDQSTLLLRASQQNWLRPFSFGNGTAAELFERDCLQLFGASKPLLLDVAKRTATHCGWWRPNNDLCIMIDRPIEIHVDRNSTLHRQDGHALLYADRYGIYALRGILVSKEIAYGEFTVQDIDDCKNVEVRRVMMDRYGHVGYLRDSGAAEVQRDDCGVLYKKHIQGEEPITVVKVINSTPEPDGTFKDYYLRVPPEMQTAKEAIAWTFGMAADEYSPAKET